jgi:hypothetical protein
VGLRTELERDLGVRPRIRWGGLGQLDVLVDGKLLFSKKQAGRSPSAAEIVRLVRG